MRPKSQKIQGTEEVRNQQVQGNPQELHRTQTQPIAKEPVTEEVKKEVIDWRRYNLMGSGGNSSGGSFTFSDQMEEY